MRAHGKQGEKTGFSGSSKLTREQWEQVAAWVKGGQSVRQATVKILDTWGIEIAVSAVAANKLIQEWRQSQRLESAEQAQAALQSRVGDVADIVLNQIDAFKKESKDLKKQIKEFDAESGGLPITKLYDRLAKVDDELRKHVDTFQKLYESANKNAGLGDKLKEQDEAEAELAITELIQTLSVEVSAITEADRILDAELTPTKRNDLMPKPGETAPST